MLVKANDGLKPKAPQKEAGNKVDAVMAMNDGISAGSHHHIIQLQTSAVLCGRMAATATHALAP